MFRKGRVGWGTDLLINLSEKYLRVDLGKGKEVDNLAVRKYARTTKTNQDDKVCMLSEAKDG